MSRTITPSAPKGARWQAVCDRCYTCVLYTGGKRAAEREATSHLRLCPGHTVTILAIDPDRAGGQS